MTADEPGRAARGLDGVRVLELGEMVSAPYAAKLMADLGADVIKVEPPEGERARHRGPFRAAPDPDASGLYLALNTNKRSVVVGPDDHHDRLDPLLASADVILTNWPADRLATVGIDLDELHLRRPDAVLCSILPFGRTGPHAHYRAEELTVAHAGGWAYQCPGDSPDPANPPLKVFGHQADFHAGLAAATVAMAALDRRARTGVGDLIDLSSMAHVTGMLEAAVIGASYLDENPHRLGSRLLNPWGIFDCADGLMFLVTVEQDQWERLVELMDRPSWTETGLFDTVELRLENEDLLRLYLGEWMAGQKVDDLWHRGQAARVCFAPVLSMADLADQQHLVDRSFFATVDHPKAGQIRHLGPPFRASNGMWGPLRPAPLLDPAATPAFAPSAEPTGPAATERTPTAAGTTELEAARAAGRPLEGVRVLDLSWVWAGPYGAMHLAHLGAEVVKVESANRPGLGRRLALHPPELEPTLNTCAYFNQWEQGKTSCAIDLSHPEGAELVRTLASSVDVVVENFATGVMERLGLGYERLRAVNPGIIVASISGYGSEGPLRRFMGYGPTTGPLSGLSSLTGYDDGRPRELGISVGDPAAGITAAMAVVAALHHRRRTGDGSYIDVALWEATTSCAVEGWMQQELAGHTTGPDGNRDPLMAPHNCYRALDPVRADDGSAPADEPDPGHWVSIACADDERWRALARLIDPALVDDRRFTTAADRKRNEDRLDAIVARWVAGRDRWTVTESLQEVGVAAFPSMSPKDLLAYEHLWDRGFFERLAHAEVGRRIHTGLSWRSATNPGGVAAPAPLLGEHTDDVLGRIAGLSPDAIADLRRRGICV
ncbi:MAG: CoA transferase [Actinomycetota bacterium]